MIIGGFAKKSLIEYKNKISCIVFTKGCNFRCPFCHNAELIPYSKQGEDENEIFEYMHKYRDWLDAVAITGGEPTLQSDLYEFIEKIKKMGFLIKLESNGSNPEMLKKLIENNMIDSFQMDLKAPPVQEEYNKLAGVEVDLDMLKKSIRLIIDSGKEYEFVTTAIPGYHTEKVIEDIINGFGIDKYHHRIQNYRDENVYNKKGVEELISEESKCTD